MKKTFLLLTLVCFSLNMYAGNDYTSLMQKGISMIKEASSIQQSIDAANFFERVAEANKSEWLPLYYAAYASLAAGFQQTQNDKKDEWYTKGLGFIEKAKAIKEDESELYALEGYLKLMYISNEPMKRAPLQTGGAIKLLEKAKALNPANPRPWFIHGQNTFYTPEFFGGGPDNAKPLLEKAKGLYENFKKVNDLMPEWGGERCEMLLQKCNEVKNK